MKDLLDQIEAASHAQLYYVALAGALMIPDIAERLRVQTVERPTKPTALGLTGGWHSATTE